MQDDLEKSQKQAKYFCEICQYKTDNKKDYNKHNSTTKHKKRENGGCLEDDGGYKNPITKCEKLYYCECGKYYKYGQGLWKHKKSCIPNKEIGHDIITTSSSDSEVKILTNLVLDVVKQNQELTNKIVDICKQGFQTNNISNSNINSNNKTFNLQFFLNETCKNAMNITDFINSLQLQLSDLENVGKLGYVDGISSIIVKNLNALDETTRPIHCTDKKRETMYVKDADKWEKEDEQKSRLRNVVNGVANKNIKLLPQFREKYPDYKNSSSKTSDKYDKIVIEAMTCDEDKNEKIIKNISKEVVIDKNN